MDRVLENGPSRSSRPVRRPPERNGTTTTDAHRRLGQRTGLGAEVGARDVVEALARASIGATFNQYADGPRAPLLRARLAEYLESRRDAPILLVGEAAGYRGARVSGIPFTSERQLTGDGPAEATATVVHRVLAEMGLEEDVLLWNVVPTHPGSSSSNRRPTRAEIGAGRPFLEGLTPGRSVIAVGRIAAEALAVTYVRHPSHGGANAFRQGLRTLLHSSAGGHSIAVSCP